MIQELVNWGDACRMNIKKESGKPSEKIGFWV